MEEAGAVLAARPASLILRTSFLQATASKGNTSVTQASACSCIPEGHVGVFNRDKFKVESVEWETPIGLFARLNREFGFTLDVAASGENAKVPHFFGKDKDGLLQDWGGHCCWMNPPYGNELRKWVEKASRESQKENTVVVALIPSKTNTRWWHQFVMQSREIRFIQGRPKFGTSKHGLPFPLAIVVFARHSGLPLLSGWIV